MKILFISSWFPNKLEPTNGNFVQRHAEAVALKHDVEILHTIGDFNQKETFVFDDKIINGIRTLVIYYRNSKNPVQNFLRRMKAYKIGFSKMQKPELVHANVLHNNMLFAVYLKKKYKIPFVLTEHWTALRKVNLNKTSFIIRQTAKMIGNQAAMILPVSHDLKDSLNLLGIKTPKKVIPNVVDTKLFTPQNANYGDFTFIHISNLIPRKNADTILNVTIKLLKEGYLIKLKIGGDGETKNLREIVKKEGLEERIEIFDTITSEEVSNKLKFSDCFILLSDDENQPCVISEAFASGIKVISTNVGGIAEFFPIQFGLLLDSPDSILLENAMKKMITEGRRWDRNEIASYADETFSKESICSQFSAIYEEII